MNINDLFYPLFSTPIVVEIKSEMMGKEYFIHFYYFKSNIQQSYIPMKYYALCDC